MPRRRPALPLALLLAIACALPAARSAPAREPPPPAYATRPASADGIGKLFMGREIARVMGWQGAAWLERDERAQEERPDLLLPALGLQPGMVIADVGAGTGYWSRRLARAVAPGGIVYASDLQPQMLAIGTRLAERAGIANIRHVQASATDANLPPAAIDLAIMVDVYHELEYPQEALASVVRALKPGGRVVFVEYKAEDPRVPIKPLHKMSEAQIRREAALHPLDWVETIGTLPWQHAVVFRKR